jgi:hypothetical protein
MRGEQSLRETGIARYVEWFFAWFFFRHLPWPRQTNGFILRVE